jgi:hypothetical protein
MKKEMIVLFIIAALAVLLAGCGGTGTTTSDTDPFIGGTSSLDISFEKDAPPAEVYAGNQYPFDIVVKLVNTGEYDVKKEDVKVKLLGVEPTLFGISQLEKNAVDDLLATKKSPEGSIINGVESQVEFTNLNYQQNLDATINDLPIKADVCFKYGTKIRSKICVKKDVLDNKKSSICTINEPKTVYNSAGPVQVSELIESAQGTSKLAFTFSVKHDGTGYIYSKGSKCPEVRGEENKVWINVDAGLTGLSCTGITPDGTTSSGISGTINLGENGDKTIRCTLDVSNAATDFEKSISMELVYDYKKDISTSLTIKPNVN